MVGRAMGLMESLDPVAGGSQLLGNPRSLRLQRPDGAVPRRDKDHEAGGHSQYFSAGVSEAERIMKEMDHEI